jgi:hypothetical protein
MFTGSYDGNGHKISNLLINPIRDNGAIYNNNAFFGFTGSASEIKNLRIENFSISGGRIIGGLVGRNYGTINNCYSTGSGAMGTDDVGGLVGVNGGPIDSSFWNIDLAGTTGIGGGTITGGTGKITTEMKTKSTFTDAGWDPNIWNIGDGINDGYPYLKWQNPGGTPLPVELVSFTASLNKNAVMLNWKTATEVNNYGFEVERSQRSEVGGENNWEKIGFVKGNGNSNSPKSYSFSDATPPCGKVLYKLKQIDIDGIYKYSIVVEVNVDAPSQFVLEQNYPNPFNPTTKIKFDLPKESNVTLKIFNMLGQEVITLVNKVMLPGHQEVIFNASELASGMYIYRIQAGNFVQTKKSLLMK